MKKEAEAIWKSGAEDELRKDKGLDDHEPLGDGEEEVQVDHGQGWEPRPRMNLLIGFLRCANYASATCVLLGRHYM